MNVYELFGNVAEREGWSKEIRILVLMDYIAASTPEVDEFSAYLEQRSDLPDRGDEG